MTVHAVRAYIAKEAGHDVSGQSRDDHGRFGEGGSSGGDHTIAARDVAEFLKGSALTEPMYHVTSAESAKAITEHGVDVERGTGAYGQGFYATSSQNEDVIAPSAASGQRAILGVAVRLENPFVVDSSVRGSLQAWHTLEDAAYVTSGGDEQKTAVELRNVMLHRGYDGVVVRHPHGRNWAIAMKPGSVKVVK